MKKMFKGLVVLSMTLLTVAAMAQPPRGQGQGRPDATPEESARRMTGMMTERLNLTESQQKQIYDACLDMMKKRQEMMNRGAETREDVRADFEKQRAAHQERIKEILTPEQFKEYQSMMSSGGMGMSPSRMRNDSTMQPRRGDAVMPDKKMQCEGCGECDGQHKENCPNCNPEKKKMDGKKNKPSKTKKNKR